MKKNILNSSACQVYETPKKLFNELDQLFNFKLDVCANKDNAKCKKYYDEEQDGLKQEWSKMNWCNPPFKHYQKKWINKAFREFVENNNNTICLIPSRVDTILYQDLIFKHAPYICFIKGRLKFEGCKNQVPFPTSLILFVKELNTEQVNYFKSIGTLLTNNIIFNYNMFCY